MDTMDAGAPPPPPPPPPPGPGPHGALLLGGGLLLVLLLAAASGARLTWVSPVPQPVLNAWCDHVVQPHARAWCGIPLVLIDRGGPRPPAPAPTGCPASGAAPTPPE